MTTTKTTTSPDLIENVLAAAMDLPNYEIGGELDQLCERATKEITRAAMVADKLRKHRDNVRAVVAKMEVVKSEPNARAALLQVWKPALRQLEQACKRLGVA